MLKPGQLSSHHRVNARLNMSPSTRARASRSCGNCRAVKRRVSRSFPFQRQYNLNGTLTLLHHGIKCDKQSPQCGQCIRTRETCRGYRDEWDLVFRDQTSHTIKRSKKKLANNTISTELPLTHSPPPARGPDLSLDEIGVNYFLQDFVAAGRVPTRGYLNYIPTLCRNSTRARKFIDRPLPAVHWPTPVHSGSAMRTQILSSFIQLHFPPDKPMSSVNLQQFLHSGIYRLPWKSEMLDKALTAMSCLFLGKTQRDSRIFCHGLRLYNDAIGIMSRLIHQNTYSDEILYAAFIFQEIAVWIPTNPLPSLRHLRHTNNQLIHYIIFRDHIALLP